jgi:hypothetical protein
MVAQLHGWLAYASVVLVGAVAIDAAWRAWSQRPPGVAADRLESIVVLALLITSAGGLGLLVGGSGPREPLHLLYAVIGLAAFPVASSLSGRASPRRRALITLVIAVVVLVVVARLFQTG